MSCIDAALKEEMRIATELSRPKVGFGIANKKRNANRTNPMQSDYLCCAQYLLPCPDSFFVFGFFGGSSSDQQISYAKKIENVLKTDHLCGRIAFCLFITFFHFSLPIEMYGSHEHLNSGSMIDTDNVIDIYQSYT